MKVLLPNETNEYLVTNLSESDFPVGEIKALYNLRGDVEVSFLFLKYGMAMNYFHYIHRDFIGQEIFAKLILLSNSPERRTGKSVLPGDLFCRLCPP